MQVIHKVGGRLVCIGALALLLVWRGPAVANEAVPVVRYAIDQPAQALAGSLRSIARQTGISVLFDPGAVQGRMAQPVLGRLSAIEAISRALVGTGLAAEVMKDGVVVVRPAAAAAPTTPAGTSSGTRSDQLPPPMQIAAADGGGAPGPASVDAEGVGSKDPAQRIEVTGSRLKRVAFEGPTPVNTYTREDIDRSGQPNLERFLAGLNEVSMSAGEGGFGSTLGQASVQLRGLPIGSTLVLINGRRVQAVGSAAANIFNLNLIPLAAVERVEIVPVGSSAVYGGDALAGVVNVILKKSIDGHSFAARLGSGRGTSDGSVSLATGGADEAGSYLLLGSYSRTTPLTAAERSFFRDGDYRRFGGTDVRVRNCTPGTVSSAGGGNLPGLGASFAGIPALAPDRVPVVADFVPTSGQANLCNLWANGRGYTLVHGTETLGLHALGDRRLGGGWSIFGELSVAEDRLHARDIGLSLNNVLVPASNPFNPFGEDVRVTALLGPDNGLQGFKRHTRFTRGLLGLRGEVGAGWDAEITLSTTRDSGGSRTFNGVTDVLARTAALAASAPGAALNPFTAGRAASDEVLQSIWSDTTRESHGRKDQAGAFVRGSPLALPAGPLETIVGAEWSRDIYETTIPGDLAILDSRRTGAVYGELRAPLLRSDAAAGRAWSLAALTLAARRDRYNDFGSASTYQAGLEVRPARGLLLRASTATSFKPPTMLQTNVDPVGFPAEWFGLVDPARDGEPVVTGEVVRGTNPALGPERGRAHALGAVWEPEGAEGTRFGLTAWRVRIDGLISILDPQAALDYEALFPGFVTRGPATDGRPGPVSQVLLAEVNFGGVDTAGVDVEAAYAWRTPTGRWSLGAGATRTTEYRVVLAPGAPEQDRLGRRFTDHWAPKWKARLWASLVSGPWTVGATSRYVGAYKDAGTRARQLGDFWVHDLSASVDLKKFGMPGSTGLKAAVLSLGVANLTDRQPQFVETLPYYDVTQADWRGRYANVRLSVDW
jgi:iron complex outermembrane receptor protein